VRNQRRLRKAARVRGYFTVTMLDNELVIRKGMVGLDPDRSDEGRQLGWWLARYVRRVREPEPVGA